MLRISGLANVGQPIIVCNQDYRFIIAEQMHDIGYANAQIILEPEGKNTAPAITIAALHLEEQASDAVMLVLPADHVINDHETFKSAVTAAAKIADARYAGDIWRRA